MMTRFCDVLVSALTIGMILFCLGCQATNETVVIPEEQKKFSDVHDEYQDLKEKFGFDENFEPDDSELRKD